MGVFGEVENWPRYNITALYAFIICIDLWTALWLQTFKGHVENNSSYQQGLNKLCFETWLITAKPVMSLNVPILWKFFLF